MFKVRCRSFCVSRRRRRRQGENFSRSLALDSSSIFSQLDSHLRRKSTPDADGSKDRCLFNRPRDPSPSCLQRRDETRPTRRDAFRRRNDESALATSDSNTKKQANKCRTEPLVKVLNSAGCDRAEPQSKFTHLESHVSLFFFRLRF